MASVNDITQSLGGFLHTALGKVATVASGLFLLVSNAVGGVPEAPVQQDDFAYPPRKTVVQPSFSGGVVAGATTTATSSASMSTGLLDGGTLDGRLATFKSDMLVYIAQLVNAGTRGGGFFSTHMQPSGERSYVTSDQFARQIEALGASLQSTSEGFPALIDENISDTITASNYLPLAGGILAGSLTGTNLTLSGTLTAGTLSVAAVSSGGAVEATYFNATSSTISTFAGGLLSLASTTIGGGTQTTGLTISGGATTTGNSYFTGNVGIGMQPSATHPLVIQGSVGALSVILNNEGNRGNVQISDGNTILAMNSNNAYFYGNGGIMFAAQANCSGMGCSTGVPNSRPLAFWLGNPSITSVDAAIAPDAANTLAQRNLTAAQEYRIYNTDNGSDDEFASLGWINNSNVFGIETEETGSGTVRNIALLGGNVGIGTSSPTQALTVAGNILVNSTSNYIGVVDSTHGAISNRRLDIDDSTYVDASAGDVGSFSNSWGFESGGGYNFNINSVPALSIPSSRNVGIGTTSPYAKLSVVGPVVAEYFHATSTTATSTFSGMLSAGPDASRPSIEITNNGRVTFGYQFTPTDDYVLRIDKANDEVLVGNTLQFVTCCGNGIDLIQGSANSMIVGSYWDETQGNHSRFGVDSNDYFSASVNGYLKLVSGGTERVSILPSSGNVGIGTTSPWRTLSVAGTVAMPAVVNDSTGYYVCLNTTTGQMATSTTACGASSIVFKENVQDLSYGLDAINSFRPVSFTYKDSYIHNGGTQLGFIAEEVDEIVPELVAKDSAGTIKGLDYPKFTAVIVKGMQELAAKVSETAHLIIDTLVARRIETQELCTKKSDGTMVCMSGDQLAAMLAAPGGVQTVQIVDPVLSDTVDDAVASTTPTFDEDTASTSTPLSLNTSTAAEMSQQELPTPPLADLPPVEEIASTPE